MREYTYTQYTIDNREFERNGTKKKKNRVIENVEIRIPVNNANIERDEISERTNISSAYFALTAFDLLRVKLLAKRY